MTDRKMNILKTLYFVISFSLIFFFSPFAITRGEYTEEYGVVVKCNTELDNNGNFVDPCGFDNIMEAINTVIDFLLFWMVIPIAAIVFMIAGGKLLLSGGSSEARTSARKAFMNIFIGLLVALAAWLIVKFILDGLGYQDSLGFFS